MLNSIRHSAVGLLLACVTSTAQCAPLEMTPQQLFAGHSEGNGSLKILLGKTQPFHVESRGQAQPDGSFRLDQTVTFEGKPAQDRTWILETVGPRMYAGTLSDAAGEVTGRSEGNRLILRYRIKGPMVMQQTLELLADGKTIDNTGTLTLLGIPIGRLHEIIIR
ncbi:MAG: DUF3833 family protein [Xanthomonadales bacterium]|nr:DUF3833 family protein [Xanthomonadales bacterium]